MTAHPAERAAARRHLEALARAPRPAGGKAESAARAYCADVLTAAGLAVAEEPFSYSELPGRVATPVLGLISGALLAVTGHLGWRNEPGSALALMFGGGVILGLAARWVTRSGVLTLPWLRHESSNLVASRGNPSVWLVAHLDSKSQPVAILVRALGVIGILVSASCAAAVAALHIGGSDVRWMWPWITALGVLSSLPVMASVVQSRSPGALDDASGVSTVLMVAQSLPQQLALGVVLTSAEELGLAGARAWVRGRGAVHAINVDGVDDDGTLQLTWTRRRPTSLVDLLRKRAEQVGVSVRVGRLIPGALLDGVALADAGWQVVTVSRGTLRTVSRIHTPRDSLEHLRGDGIAATASIILAAIAEGA